MIWIELDRTSGVSLSKQLYDQVVDSILAGRLEAGLKLPSSRTLASDLGIARNSVVEVYEQILSEGFVESRHGSGTYVRDLPLGKRTRPQTSEACQNLEEEEEDPNLIAFDTGVPDLDAFPQARWLSCLRQACHYGDDVNWGYSEGLGRKRLRKEIALLLNRTKGIDCSAEQIVVTQGISQAILLLSLLFAQKKPGVILEDPVASFAPAIFRQCGHAIAPVPVDADGLMVDRLPKQPKAGMLYVTPSHQFPLGGTLPIQRRLVLLEYAQRHDLYIVEDDYDSEFRFSGAPVSSLCRIDQDRVAHLGTFSKSLAPSLRLGYMALPSPLAESYRTLAQAIHHHPPLVQQEAMAIFLKKGHLDQQLARLRRLYHTKKRTLVQAFESAFGKRVRLSGMNGGIHIVATFDGIDFNNAQLESIRRAGVSVEAVDHFAIGPPRHPHSLVIGYGNLSLTQIEEGVRKLATALSSPIRRN